MTGSGPAYYVSRRGASEERVSMEEFVRAEREAGFYNETGPNDLPATAGFGDSFSDISGRVVYT